MFHYDTKNASKDQYSWTLPLVLERLFLQLPLSSNNYVEIGVFSLVSILISQEKNC